MGKVLGLGFRVKGLIFGFMVSGSDLGQYFYFLTQEIRGLGFEVWVLGFDSLGFRVSGSDFGQYFYFLTQKIIGFWCRPAKTNTASWTQLFYHLWSKRGDKNGKLIFWRSKIYFCLFWLAYRQSPCKVELIMLSLTLRKATFLPKSKTQTQNPKTKTQFQNPNLKSQNPKPNIFEKGFWTSYFESPCIVC